MKRGKQGQGMSTSTIVLLILAVVVLVILILGFTMGWNKVAPWLSRSNVDDVVNTCSAACSTGGAYDFCRVERELIDEKKNKFSASCAVFSTTNDFGKYGVKTCSINCDLTCPEIFINGKPGDPNLNQGYDVSSLAGGNCFVPKA